MLKIKTRKRLSTEPNLTNLFDTSNNHYPNQITTSLSHQTLIVKKPENKTRTEQNEEVNNKNKILKQVNQSQEVLLIQVEKGDKFKLKKMTTARIIATNLSQ